MTIFIGVGAAGNKAVINLKEEGVVVDNDMLLLNTTLQDIPEDYHHLAVKFGDGRGGAGKEPKLSKEALIRDLKTNSLPKLESILRPSDDMVYIVTSTEGGTGNGASGLLAQYYKEGFDRNVTIVAFDGFEDDVRGLNNAVSFFKSIPKGITVQVISNQKFLDKANGNKIKAQELANTEFVERMKVILGFTKEDGDNNIDNTDLYKLVSFPGFMTVEIGSIPFIADQDSFNKLVKSILGSSKSINNAAPGYQRVGIILNIRKSTESAIDFDFPEIKSRYGGEIVEFFHHIQYIDENSNAEQYINVIASGGLLPIDEILDKANRLEVRMKAIKKDDSFFDKLSDLDVDALDSYNTGKDKSVSANKKASFLAGLSMDGEEVEVEKDNKGFLNNY